MPVYHPFENPSVTFFVSFACALIYSFDVDTKHRTKNLVGNVSLTTFSKDILNAKF